jgi:RHS repeat-associated protein
MISISLSYLGEVPKAEGVALISQQRYLPFGAVRTNVTIAYPLGTPNSPNTDYGYTGQRNLDDEIGLMDYKARFYSPYLNRFIQPDSIVPEAKNPQAWNRYSYVNNRPIIFNDPTGHCPYLPLCLVAGMLALTAVVADLSKDNELDMMPDALVISVGYTDSTSTLTQYSDDKNSPFMIQNDHVITLKQSAEFATSTYKAGPVACPALASCNKASSYAPYAHGITPIISGQASVGLVWGDNTIEKNIREYSGKAYNISIPLGNFSLNGFSSVDIRTGRVNFKTVGISIGISTAPKVPSIGAYYTNTTFQKFLPTCYNRRGLPCTRR